MFYFPHLRAALDEYAQFLQNIYKSRVQVRTGSLRHSIKVWCEWQDQVYTLCFTMNDYYKWIPEVFPVKRAVEVAGTLQGGMNFEMPVFYKYSYDAGRRYPINWDTWQEKLNDAFLKDIQAAIEAEEG